jgi:Na+-transporting methylmalonyl-CoA/oxaloacetate decarboxylase gamma subunit
MMFEGPAFVFLFLSVGAVALFGFLAVAAWSGARQHERESYYRNDMLKKLAESDTNSAAATLAYLQEKERAAEAKSEAKKREGYLVGGLINMAVGIGLMAFLGGIAHDKPAVGLVGLMPFLIGVALLISAYLTIPKRAA